MERFDALIQGLGRSLTMCVAVWPQRLLVDGNGKRLREEFPLKWASSLIFRLTLVRYRISVALFGKKLYRTAVKTGRLTSFGGTSVHRALRRAMCFAISMNIT